MDFGSPNEDRWRPSLSINVDDVHAEYLAIPGVWGQRECKKANFGIQAVEYIDLDQKWLANSVVICGDSGHDNRNDPPLVDRVNELRGEGNVQKHDDDAKSAHIAERLRERQEAAGNDLRSQSEREGCLLFARRNGWAVSS